VGCWFTGREEYPGVVCDVYIQRIREVIPFS